MYAHTYMHAYETPFLDRSKRKSSGPEKSTVQKKARAVSEAGERAVRDGLFGATGPESVLNVVKASRPKNGATKPSIFDWFYKVFRLGRNTCAL